MAGADCTATEPGSVLNYAGWAPTASLDPLQSSGSLAGGTELIAIYDVLMREGDAAGTWIPHAAESLEPNTDFTVWTLKLRPELKYSNGDPMLAEHVLDNLQRLLGKGINGSRAVIALVDLESSKVIDERTAEIHLFAPWSTFPHLLADAPGMVVNPAVGAKTDSSGASLIGKDPAGAGIGPYSVERWAPGESPYLVLKARPDYWGGPPCVETINFLSIPQDQTKVEALDTGELDVGFLRAGSAIAEARKSGYSDSVELNSNSQVLLINLKPDGHNPITADVRFRRAVYAAIDPATLRDRGYSGSLILQDAFLHQNSRYASPDQPAPKRDPELAKKLVTELRADGWDGRVRLLVNNLLPDLPVAIETLLEIAGIDVEMTVIDVNASVAAVVGGDYDIALWGYSTSDSSIWHSLLVNFTSTSASNRNGFADPRMDAAIKEFFAAPDLTTQRGAVAKMSEVYAEQIPAVVFGAMEEGVFWRSSVTGIIPTQRSMFLLQDVRVTA